MPTEEEEMVDLIGMMAGGSNSMTPGGSKSCRTSAASHHKYSHFLASDEVRKAAAGKVVLLTLGIATAMSCFVIHHLIRLLSSTLR